ncbi:MAG: hypothetical protein R2864_03080 [Syntrophotaleaceae bacterium]
MKCFKTSSFMAQLLLIAGLLFCPGQIFAQAVQLAWDPSPSSDIAGYKIYYKAASSELPLDGIEALEGPSPVDVGNVTSLHPERTPGRLYLLLPCQCLRQRRERKRIVQPGGQRLAPCHPGPGHERNCRLIASPGLEHSPENLDLSFSLRFGTDPELRTNIKVNKGRLKKDATFTPTMVFDDLADNSYATSDLSSGTIYYWQVIATDGSGQQFASVISSFAAE